jgi:hypothetical protein
MMDLNEEHHAIGDAVIILTSRSKQLRLDKSRGLPNSSKMVRAMMFQGCREAYRVQVVERDFFTTPNSLKSHEGQKVLSPLVQYSCRNAEVVRIVDANTRRRTPDIQITYRC